MILAAVIAAVALLGGAVATAAALTGPKSGRAGRVAKLVHVPATARLGLTIRRDTVEVTNRSNRALTWRATADAPWLEVRPRQGELASGQTRLLTTRVLPSSPEGALRTTVTVTGDDGSAAAAVYETTLERPPDVAASAEGCGVTATVEDTSGVGAVTLHWTDNSGAHETTMAPGPTGYTAGLPGATPLTWWVAAADTRGNQARTPEAHSAC